jgi:hypothetical protein
VFLGVNERGLRGWLHSYNQVWLLGVVLCRKVRKLRLLCLHVFVSTVLRIDGIAG